MKCLNKVKLIKGAFTLPYFRQSIGPLCCMKDTERKGGGRFDLPLSQERW